MMSECAPRPVKTRPSSRRDADRHLAERVDAARDRLHRELGELVRDVDDAVDGLVDGVDRAGAVARVDEVLAVAVDELDGRRRDARARRR